MEKLDVVVLGCGIVGLAAAWQLARRGLRVAAIDRAAVGGGTSAATFAWINATSKTESEAYHRLNAAGLRAYKALAREIGAATIGLAGAGSLQWAPAENRRLAAKLRVACERLNAWAYPVEWLEGGELRRRWPAIALPDAAVGLFAPDDRWLEVPTLLEWLAVDFARHGGRLLEHRGSIEIGRDGSGAVVSVATGNAGFQTRAVVLAGGVETPALAALAAGEPTLGDRFPLRVVPGFLVELPPASGVETLDLVLWAADDDGFHLRPTARGGLLLGADDIDDWVGEGGNPSLVARAMAALLERARDWLPSLALDGVEPAWRIGRRPVPLDGQTLIGPLAAAPGAWVVATHSGVTLALHLGALLAEEIATGRASPSLEDFRPGRFGL